MVKKITINEFLELRENIPVIDVRSPSEYQKAHIPGAFSIPLFTDDERAEVGIAYKQKGKQQAVKLGLAIVGPKMRSLAEEGEKKAGKPKKLIVHCWRGGMRSANMAWLFSRLGIECYVLDGGYKAYRRYGRRLLQNSLNLIVLSGMTGSGKTDILNELKKSGEQVLDLEGMANHKGSAFGSIGQQEQHQTEHFENLIFEELITFNPEKPIWVEDESKRIGRNVIPDELFSQMRKCPVMKISIPRSIRIRRLVEEYTHYGDQYLKESILRIYKRLGGMNARRAIEAIENHDYKTATGIILDYYDKTYRYGLSKREPASITEMNFEDDNPAHNALKVKNYAEQKLVGYNLR